VLSHPTPVVKINPTDWEVTCKGCQLERGYLMRFVVSVIGLAAIGFFSFGEVGEGQVAEPQRVARELHLYALAAPPLELARRPEVSPLAELDFAFIERAEQLRDLEKRNLSGVDPIQNGFARQLPVAMGVGLSTSQAWLQNYGGPTPIPLAGGLAWQSSESDLVWGGKVSVEGAYRLRLHLRQLDLPDGTRFWVYSEGEEAVGPFGLELAGEDGGMWTPSVSGPSIHLEVALPLNSSNGASRFEIDEVLEIFPLDETGAPVFDQTFQPQSTSCLVDAQCVDSSTFGVIDLVQQAISHLQYVKNSNSYICTGGLLSDTDDKSVIPYLLTANHCFSSQSVASTLEAFWDFYASSCLGPWPSLGSLPRSSGATLLGTGATSDFTLVRLQNMPSNRVLLGWNANASAIGSLTPLYRVSHPLGWAQAYSDSLVSTASSTCSSWPRPRFIYQYPINGGTFGGSSGSPVLMDGGYTVGQLTGGCGPDPSDGCNLNNYQVDGAFSQSYPVISQYLNPPTFTLSVTKTGTGTGTVTSSPTGINCGTSCSDGFALGTLVVLTPTPAGDSVFAGWGGHSDCSDGQVTMNAARSCTATFNKAQVALTVTKSGSGTGTVTSNPTGIDCGVDCGELYDVGTIVVLSANPDTGCVFDGWSGGADCQDGSVTMSSARLCTASFGLQPPNDIFADGFEAGDTSAWSLTKP